MSGAAFPGLPADAARLDEDTQEAVPRLRAELDLERRLPFAVPVRPASG